MSYGHPGTQGRWPWPLSRQHGRQLLREEQRMAEAMVPLDQDNALREKLIAAGHTQH
jgi:hypothetical protein